MKQITRTHIPQLPKLTYMSGGQETLNPTKVVEILRPLNESPYSSMTSPRTTENIQSSKRPSEPQRRRKKARKKRASERERELARTRRERERESPEAMERSPSL